MAFGLTSKSKEDVTLPSDDLESLVRKTRRDILGLRLMLFTAVILLVGGFFYYNNTLQAAHRNFHLEIKNVQSQVDLLMRDRALGVNNRLEGVMEEMVVTISRLDNEPPQVQQLIEQVKENSGDFMHTYRQNSKPMPGRIH